MSLAKLGVRYCADCGGPASRHARTWIEGAVQPLADRLAVQIAPRALERAVGKLVDALFLKSRLMVVDPYFKPDAIPLRTQCFVAEARAAGIPVQAIRSPFGYTNYFRMSVRGRSHEFEGLPLAEFASRTPLSAIDDKSRSKKQLTAGGFPTLPSRAFWFYERSRARAYANTSGYPVVVKPRAGSYSRHVTTDIQNDAALDAAIRKAVRYAPTFVVERFLGESRVFRSTVIDFVHAACLERIPAGVTGDGKRTVRELVTLKNSDASRGEAHEESCTLFKIIFDHTSEELLRAQGLASDSVVPAGTFVALQRDPFIRLGADSSDATDLIHPDNKKLFEDVARAFDVRVVGIDFLCKDISETWRDQQCAILELNSLPCIEVHHFPTHGTPRNVARAIVDLVYAYY